MGEMNNRQMSFSSLPLPILSCFRNIARLSWCLNLTQRVALSPFLLPLHPFSYTNISSAPRTISRQDHIPQRCTQVSQMHLHSAVSQFATIHRSFGHSELWSNQGACVRLCLCRLYATVSKSDELLHCISNNLVATAPSHISHFLLIIPIFFNDHTL